MLRAGNRMKSLTAMITCLTVISLGGGASRLKASIITVPTGLAPGSQYRLVFVTNLTFQATSSSISTYNNDVAVEVAFTPLLRDLGATWTAIASTDSISAADNIGASPASVGVYLLDGATLVANGTGTNGSGLFSVTPSGNFLLSPIDFTATGVFTSSRNVWTGTTYTGTASSVALGGTLVSAALGDTRVTYGAATQTGVAWVEGGITTVTSATQSLYAISSVLTVPGAAATPEPATTALAALGLASLFAALRLRKQRNLLANPTDR
jgi:hypothetical protein